MPYGQAPASKDDIDFLFTHKAAPSMSNFMMNGVNFTVSHGAAPSMAILERNLDAIKNFVNDEEVVTRNGLQFMPLEDHNLSHYDEQ